MKIIKNKLIEYKKYKGYKKYKYKAITTAVLLTLSLIAQSNAYADNIADDFSINNNTTQKNNPNPDDISISGDNITGQQNNYLQVNSTSEIPAEISYQDKLIKAKDIKYNFVEDTAYANNNVTLQNKEITVHAPSANYTFDAEKGNIEDAKYTFIKQQAHGKAKNIKLEKYIVNLKNATYTTCTPEDEAWYLSSKELNIDERNDIATAKNAKLVFLGIPIFAAPYISFALNKQRRSGFLVPTFSLNSRAGVDVSVPYYFNIAPQHDATIYPRILSRRGVLMGAEFRYLNPNYNGRLSGEFLPNDAKTKTKRWAFSIEHNHKITPWLNAYANIERVSDNSYPDDFSKRLSDYSKRLYTQEIGLKAVKQDDKQDLQFLLRYKHHQALVDVPPYNLQPQANLIYQRNISDNLQLNTEHDISIFNHENKIQGKRAFSDINLGYSIDNLSYYIRPNVRLHSASYWLNNGINFTKVIPTFSVDSSLFFEKKIIMNSNDKGKRTLEPRLFYVYTPYKNQDEAPLFDTSEPEFGINSLFSNNRFIGHDRISDANQITLGITSRNLDENGNEKSWITIGQRYQIKDTKVNIDNKASKGFSDFIVQGEWKPNQTFNTNGDIQFNPHDNKLVKLSTQINWNRSANQSLGIGYKYRQKTDALNYEPFKQVTLYNKWQINPKWKINSQISYDIHNKDLSNAFIGIDYIHLCWQMRTGIDRVVGSDGKYTTRGIIQLAFTGLGNGLDPR